MTSITRLNRAPRRAIAHLCATGRRTQTFVTPTPRIAYGAVGAVAMGLAFKWFAVGAWGTRIGYEARILALAV